MFAFRSRGRERLLALLLSSLVVSAASAADLTLRAVVDLTSERSPQLRAFAFESETLRQQALAKAAAPPISLEGQLENFAGSGDVAGVRELETTLQLSKVFELGGKARHRSALGAAELDAAEAQQRALRADVVAEAARRFLRVLADQAQLEAADRATVLVAQARDVVAARIREGAISSVFLNRAEIALARARIARDHAEHELAASRVELSVSWGEPDAAFARARGELFEFQQLETLDGYVARLDANPDLEKFASDRRLLAARKRLAEAQRTPSVTVSAGVRRLEGIDEQAFVAGFSIPLGMRARAEPEVRAAQAEGEQLELNAASRRLELRALLFGLYQEIAHAKAEAETLHAVIKPQAERMVETTAEGYRQGRYSLVELIDAQQALIEVERDSIRAALDFHTNLVEIERATGVGMHALAR